MKKIVIVEDDQILIKMYTKLLTAHGYEVFSASDAKTGLETIKIQNPDLILLDIMLPGGMNGFDLLEELRRDEQFKQIPVLVMTNIDSEEKIAQEIGAQGYLIKMDNPPEKILAKIDEIFNNSNYGKDISG